MTNQITKLDRKDFVLGALACAENGSSFLPVQMQKLFFLIDREAANISGGPYFKFTPFDYGPFDKEVYDELYELSKAQKVEINHANKPRLYALTSEGRIEGQKILAAVSPELREYISQAAKWVLSLDFPKLVSAVYKKYPDMRQNSIFQ